MIQERSRLEKALSATDIKHTETSQAYLQLPEPLLTLVRFLLAECQIDQLLISLLSRSERNHVLRHITEVFPGVFVCTGSQSLCIYPVSPECQ